MICSGFNVQYLCFNEHDRIDTYARNIRMRGPDEIIERGVREHPELSVGSNTDGIDVRSVGNSQVLQVRLIMSAKGTRQAWDVSLS